MVKLRMRTKFLLSMLLISAGLTCTTPFAGPAQRPGSGQATDLRRPG